MAQFLVGPSACDYDIVCLFMFMYCAIGRNVWEIYNKPKWKKKRPERCKHCALSETKMLAPPQTPFPEMRDGQNLISWRWSLPLPTNPVWWGSMHAISSYRCNRLTHPQTNKQTGLITIHCTGASAQSKHHAFLKVDAKMSKILMKFWTVTCVVYHVQQAPSDILQLLTVDVSIKQKTTWSQIILSYG